MIRGAILQTRKLTRNQIRVKKLSKLFSSNIEEQQFDPKISKIQEGYLEYLDEQEKSGELQHLRKSIQNKERNIIQLTGVPKEWSIAQTHRYFDPGYNNISKVVPVKDSAGRNTNRCLIYAKDKNYAKSFVDRYNNDFINTEEVQNHLRCHVFDLKTQKRRLKQMDAKGKLMLYNIPFEATNVEIADACSYYGKIVDMYMPLKSDEKNNGYAIVEFEDKKSAKEMMKKVSIPNY